MGAMVEFPRWNERYRDSRKQRREGRSYRRALAQGAPDVSRLRPAGVRLFEGVGANNGAYCVVTLGSVRHVRLCHDYRDSVRTSGVAAFHPQNRSRGANQVGARRRSITHSTRNRLPFVEARAMLYRVVTDQL